MSRSFVASTTMRMFLCCKRSIMSSYISLGRLEGMLPARIRVSFSVNASSCLYRASNSSAPMIGPRPLISVSSSDAFTLTLMRVNPSRSRMKSSFTPNFLSCVTISSPVNPAMKPSAVVSMPRLLSTIDTLIPLPPPRTYSWVVRLIVPVLR